MTYQAPIFGLAGGFAQGAFQGTSIQKTYSMGVNYNRIFSPDVDQRVPRGRGALSQRCASDRLRHHRLQGHRHPGRQHRFTGPAAWRASIINGGFSTPLVGYVNSLPWSRAEANISVVNSWTKTVGNHTIKWGVDYRRLRDDLLQTQTINPRGLFNFNTAQTSLNPGPGGVAPKTGRVNNMASFLLDQPSDGGRDIAAYFPAFARQPALRCSCRTSGRYRPS